MFMDAPAAAMSSLSAAAIRAPAMTLTRRLDVHQPTGARILNERFVKVTGAPPLGEGQYGTVKLYRLLVDSDSGRLGAPVAVKALDRARMRRTRTGPDATALDDVWREVAALTRCATASTHGASEAATAGRVHVVSLLEAIDDSTCRKLYLAMTCANAGTLEHALARCRGTGDPPWCRDALPGGGGVSVAAVLLLIRQLSAAIAFLYECAHVIHGDIQASNVLVCEDGGGNDHAVGVASPALLAALASDVPPRGMVLQLADLNTCHLVDPPHGPMRTRSPGTAVFSPPECCEGVEKYNGHLADVWALGVLGYLAAFGAVPCARAVCARRRAEVAIAGDDDEGDDASRPPSVLEVYRAIAREPNVTMPEGASACLTRVLGACLVASPSERLDAKGVYDMCAMSSQTL